MRSELQSEMHQSFAAFEQRVTSQNQAVHDQLAALRADIAALAQARTVVPVPRTQPLLQPQR